MDDINRIINFLNDRYKDAMTMDEYMSNFRITLEEIGNILNNGVFEDGAKRLFMERLMSIPTEKRPLYCIPPTENRTAVFFVKHHDEWKPETKDMNEFILRARSSRHIELNLQILDYIVECSDTLNGDLLKQVGIESL
jgi:hypothetical protein